MLCFRLFRPLLLGPKLATFTRWSSAILSDDLGRSAKRFSQAGKPPLDTFADQRLVRRSDVQAQGSARVVQAGAFEDRPDAARKAMGEAQRQSPLARGLELPGLAQIGNRS